MRTKLTIQTLLPLILLLGACSTENTTSPDAAGPPVCSGSGSLSCKQNGLCDLPDGGVCGRGSGSAL